MARPDFRRRRPAVGASLTLDHDSEALLAWTHAGVHYSLEPIADHQVLLLAIGPGVEVRIRQQLVSDAIVADWLTMPEGERSGRAEAILDPLEP